MNNTNYFFTSESVTEGHPDKMMDQVSDAILDAILEQDPFGRVAVECLTKTGFVVVAGEVTTNAKIDATVDKTTSPANILPKSRKDSETIFVTSPTNSKIPTNKNMGFKVNHFFK